MKPICVPCHRFYRPKKNGYAFIEGRPVDNQVPAGRSHEHKWVPYKLWMGDLWECKGCGHQIVSGVGHEPIAQDYHPNFKAQIDSYGAQRFQVNDC